MSAKPLPTDLPVHTFTTAKNLEAFLEQHHKTAPGFYIKFAKKGSGIASVSGSEAIEVALCFGWIDGRGNGIDDKWYTVRYTPRRAKSIWSQKNVNTVGRLLEEGRIRPAGLAAVEAAKADGRWDRAYAGPATITVPDDLAAALAAEPAAKAFFESLNSTDRYAVLFRVQTAAVQNRAKCIEGFVKKLAVGEGPGADAQRKKYAAKKVPAKRKHLKTSSEKVAPVKKAKAVTGAKIARKVEPTQPRRAGLRSRS